MKNQLTEQGKRSLNVLLKTPSQRTTRNYKALLAAMEGVSVKKSTIDKTVIREIAENSLHATATYICTVGATHILPAQENDTEAIRELMTRGTEGAKKVFNLVSQAVGNNIPMMIVQPRYVLTTDDVATYWLPAVVNKKETHNLVRSAGLKNSAVRSNYTMSGRGRCDGLRIKYTHTFSICGHTAAIFISVAGLNKRELPVESCLGGALLL